MSELQTEATGTETARPRAMRVIGVGGAGTKFIQLLAAGGADADTLAALNSDEALLRGVPASRKLLLQSSLLRGLGTGGDPDIGRAAAEELSAPIKSLCEGVEVAVLVAGLGGGTGTGAAPVVARLAREAGALALAFAVLPFDLEGKRKRMQAARGLEQLKAEADGVICLANQKLLAALDPKTPVVETFRAANDQLLGGVESVRRLFMRRGLLDIKFSTLTTALRGRHAESAFVTVTASGPERGRVLLERVRAHPLLDEGGSLAEADTVIVSLTGGAALGMAEVDALMQGLQKHCGEAALLFGADIDDRMGDRASITVIAVKRNLPAVEGTSSASISRATSAPIAEGSFDSAMGTTFLDASQPVRPPSRLVPPPPELTEQQRWEALQKHDGRGGRGRRGSRMKQGQLPLQIIAKGRFDKTEPTLHNGEDLDLPTYIRRGVALN